MKSLFFIILVFCSLIVFSQKEGKSEVASNRFDIDIQFLGVEFIYKRAITKNFNLGIGTGGVGLSSTSLTGEREGYMEFAKGKIFLEYDKLKNIRFYVGPKLSGAYFGDTDTYAALKAIEIGVFTRGYRIEIGVELSFVESSGFHSDSKRLATSYLVVKIPLKRW